MSLILTSSITNVQNQFSLDILTTGGALATVSLIISLSIALLLSDSKYWDKWSAGTLDLCSNAPLVVFAAIVLFKIMLIL